MSYQRVQTTQPKMSDQPIYGELPINVICPYCQARIMTSIVLEDGNLTYFAASALCVLGCWFGCCLIPFCMDSCKDVIHICGNCRAPIGKYNRLC
ncbi:Lipopolysaccharide-induced tumor necrosis factor-alpha factor-like [Exaiptasia diaphana]|nr:Lipopolysaccharide-induced tumor necrosis factor-alpha factor-like [Exaiptasia diaphana]